MGFIRRLYYLLERRERLQLLGLGLCMLVMALLESMGVASIVPFMQVVTRPGLVNENEWLSLAYGGLGFASEQTFLLFLGFVVLVAITVSNAFSAFTTWLIYRFAWSQNHRLSARLLTRYLERPYIFYLSRNTAGLSKNILSEVQIVIQGAVLAALRFVSRGLVALMIIGFLAVVDVRLAGIVSLVLGSAYSIVYVSLRRKQRELGKERHLQNGRRYQMASEALSGIKELKVLGRERAFIRRFRDPSWRYCQASASNQVVGTLPRYALETIAFTGILLIVLYYLRYASNVGEMLPMLSLYVFAGYRLMPSLNDVFTAAVQVRFTRPALEELYNDFRNEQDVSEGNLGGRDEENARALPLRRSIAVKDVSFRYPDAASPSLVSVNMVVERQAIVGLVGETGSGKTTLVDLVLGLLEPTAGCIEIDGQPLVGENRLLWRRSCGYIPQEIFLCDDTVAANIAFGIAPASVDDAAVRRAAGVAQIDDFISGLPNGYSTTVGERGIRLSGGQRQRIGIARALYRDPMVLIMDEATSSLDGATETAVMEMIQSLGRLKTLIIIAHRLTTVRACDAIYLLQAGKIAARGTYEELERSNEYFRALAGLESTKLQS